MKILKGRLIATLALAAATALTVLADPPSAPVTPAEIEQAKQELALQTKQIQVARIVWEGHLPFHNFQVGCKELDQWHHAKNEYEVAALMVEILEQRYAEQHAAKVSRRGR